jgi:hypothetical protein
VQNIRKIRKWIIHRFSVLDWFFKELKNSNKCLGLSPKTCVISLVKSNIQSGFWAVVLNMEFY